jgi:hypothetical protein
MKLQRRTVLPGTHLNDAALYLETLDLDMCAAASCKRAQRGRSRRNGARIAGERKTFDSRRFVHSSACWVETGGILSGQI